MSDKIKDLPVDSYSTPSVDEIKIMNSIFIKESFDFKYTKLSIIVCFIYIISFLIFIKYKFNFKYYLFLSTFILYLSIYLSVTFII